MKTNQNKSKLSLSKNTIIELNDNDLKSVNGGSTDVIESIIRTATYGTWLDFL